MPYRPLLFVFTLLLVAPFHAEASFEPGLSFPEANRYTCSSADSIGVEQAKEVLAQLLPDLSTEHDQVSDYLYVNQKSGYKSHHFLFTLHKDNVPIYGQDIALSIDEQCQLFRYQYHVDVPSNPAINIKSSTSVSSVNDAIEQVKDRVKKDGSGLYYLILMRQNMLATFSQDGRDVKPSVVEEKINAQPIYKWIDGELRLGYNVNIPLNNPDGYVESYLDSTNGSLGGFYYQGKLSPSEPLSNPVEFKWTSYGDDPGSWWGSTLSKTFWKEHAGNVQRNLPLKSLTEPESSYTQFYSNRDFHWWNHGLSEDYSDFWQQANDASRYQIPAILTNMQAIHDGFSYATETLSYDFVGERKVAVMLTDSDWRYDKYVPEFDAILIGDQNCKGSAYDPSVVYHEQGHALFARLLLQGMPTKHEKAKANIAINEAFADYWASTLLSRNEKWNGILANLRKDVCGGNGIRNFNKPEQDYFNGFEAHIGAGHSKVAGDYGEVVTETLLAAPLYRARKEIAQNAFIYDDPNLKALYGASPATALADQIILEAFLGLSMYQQYQETAYAIYQSAKRLDPKNIAAPIFRKHFTNVNLMPRDVEPSDRTVFVAPQSQRAEVAVSSRKESQSGSEVQLSFGDLSKLTMTLTAGSKQEEWIDAPSVQCFDFQQSNLLLSHTLKDNSVLQNREYNMALVGGNKVTHLQAQKSQNAQWTFSLTNDITNDSNKKVFLRINGNHGALLELNKEGSGGPIRFEQRFAHLGRYWYSLDGTALFAKGDWSLNSSAAKQVDLYIVDCIPEFTVSLTGDRKENAQLTANAMSGVTPLNNVQWRIKEFSDSAMTGRSFKYSLPNLKSPQDITLEATINMFGAARTVETKVSIQAANEPSSVVLGAPPQVDERSNVKFRLTEFTDPEGIDSLQVLWFVNDAPIGEGTTVDWVAPEVENDVSYRVLVRVIDREDTDSVTEKRTTTLIKHVNKAPKVSLTGKSVKQGETLTLVPSVSDEDNDAADLRFRWKVSMASGEESYNGRTLSLPIDKDYSGESISIEVVVSDGVDEAKASTTVTVIKVNKAPTLTLSGQTSGDADSWVQIRSQIEDESPSDVVLTWSVTPPVTWEKQGPHAIRVRMPKSAKAGEITVRATANDGEFTESKNHTIRLHAYDNTAPTIRVEGQQQAALGDSVTLQAVGYDSDNWPNELSYSWSQVDTETPANVRTHGSTLTFDVVEAMANTRLTFRAKVSDGANESSVMHVVDVGPLPKPTIVIQPYVKVHSESATVTIDASRSMPARGKLLTYSWKQTSGFELDKYDNDGSKLSFKVPELSQDQTVEFELVLSEGSQRSSQRFVLELKNKGPKARPVEKPIAVEVKGNDTENSVVKIDAAEIVELDKNIKYQYYWRKVKGPDVVWLDRESRYLKVSLSNVQVQQMSRSLARNSKADIIQMLGFELDLTTPEQGMRTYGLEVAVTQTDESEGTEAPPSTPTPSPTGDGGGGGSIGWASLLALLLLRRRR
ncbi:peptidase [Vibrio bivalvicida]|uniref:Peptidase n=1 Tax=Vibrio bivalvicida TaxID=1276888 RepID=A0ABV4MFG4_9VIBR